MMNVDPKWLINSVRLQTRKKSERWGESYANDITITRVRADVGPVYTGTGENQVVTANAVIFLYAAFSTPFPQLDDDDLDGIATIDGQQHDYQIQKIIPIQNVTEAGLYGYEIEVI